MCLSAIPAQQRETVSEKQLDERLSVTVACDRTCLGVSSLVADVIKRSHGDTFVPISVEPELRLCVVAVLHQRHLFGESISVRYEARFTTGTEYGNF